MSNCSLYGPEHPAIDEYLKKALQVLEVAFKDNDVIEFMFVERDLVINKKPFKDRSVHVENFKKRLLRKGIQRIDISKGVDLKELHDFVSDIAMKDREVKQYPHIRSGVVDVITEGISLDEIESLPFEPTQEQLNKLKEVFTGVSPLKKLQVSGIEEIVLSFLVTLRKETNILQLLMPVKTYSDYTYTHAANVMALSVFQAKALGIEGALLHDIGIAALLHDVGKLFVSQEVLHKKGSLDEMEFAEMQKHPVYGAKYLSGHTELPVLAPVVAYEHHMRYDGRGYPRSTLRTKRQHLVSQIVMIADFFDALRSRRPYKESWKIKEIFALMKKNSGTVFNPVLVGNFARAFLAATRL
ncbi:MAG: HD domain-containing protein [Nitrospirae bacterium]|nr:MAG: HD domain-containing protein [Nitrospirota bacterium]